MKWIVLSLALCLSLAIGNCSLVGGWSPAALDDEEVKKNSALVLTDLAAQNGGLCKEAYELKESQAQVVAGVKRKFVYQVTPDKCPASNSAGSAPHGNTCTIVVWLKPWENFRQILSNDCVTGGTTKKRLIGSGDHDIGHMGLFRKFMRKYNKNYSNSQEFAKRFRIFRKNMKKVKLLQKYEQGTAIYGATKFADLTEKEFRRYYLGLRPRYIPKVSVKQVDIPQIDIPDSFDWRTYNVVTTVKNQGQCGSCWAFSVTGNVEGQWAIKKKELISLSEQELVDCDKVDHGCEGGYMTDAYEQIIKLGGLESESDYPYKGSDDTCHFSKPKVKVTISDYVNISQDETVMAQWLTQNGPISIGINANAMMFYFGGVSHPFRFLCNPSSLDHGVLIVGYGVTTKQDNEYPYLAKSVPYWIVKNSWGEYWGEKGYYRVFRGDGTCGLNLMATSAEI